MKNYYSKRSVPMSPEVRNHLLNELERQRPRRQHTVLRALLLMGFSFFAFFGLVSLLAVLLRIKP